jgi:hypothetical protein
MGSFLIDSYKLRLELIRTRNPVVTTRYRIIELTASPVIIGIMERAVLAFSTVMISGSGRPAIGFLRLVESLQPRITGWLPSSEYSLWYDVLRSENRWSSFMTSHPLVVRAMSVRLALVRHRLGSCQFAGPANSSRFPSGLPPATAAEAAWNKRVDIALMTCRAMDAGQLQRS